jgi:aldose 1-epimerase
MMAAGAEAIEVGAAPVAVEPPTGWQFVLERAGQRAVVTEVGAALRSWRVGGREVLDTFDVGSAGDSFRGKVLAPWPNRIRDGRYVFGGEEHVLAVTEPERGCALHGLVLWVNWRPLRREAERVTLAYHVHPQPGYPFTLALEVEYALDDGGLTVTARATNLGSNAAPFGAAFHPYVTLGSRIDEALLTLPARARVPVDAERLLPTGAPVPVAGTEYDFTRPRRIGALALDTAYAGLQRDGDGRARARLQDSEREIVLWVDGAYDYLQAYTSDTVPDPARRRRGITIEPMTCAPDAFNSGEGLIVLAPGESFGGAWGLSARGV